MDCNVVATYDSMAAREAASSVGLMSVPTTFRSNQSTPGAYPAVADAPRERCQTASRVR
jgi:hypothetical protein